MEKSCGQNVEVPVVSRLVNHGDQACSATAKAAKAMEQVNGQKTHAVPLVDNGGSDSWRD
jgi:hypothetical protein